MAELHATHTDDDMEIEHWCPVCDRQILPAYKLVQPPLQLATPVSATASPRIVKKKMTNDDVGQPATTEPSPTLSEPVVQRPVTPTQQQQQQQQQQKKRLSTGAVRGSRVSLHRTKTATGSGFGKKKGTENLFLLDLVAGLNQQGGTATKTEASPDATSDPTPTVGAGNPNSVKGEGRVGAEVDTLNGVNAKEAEEGGDETDPNVKRPLKRGNSDRALDALNRNQPAVEKSTSAKKKSTGQEALQPLARAKSTTKVKAGPKARPKGLNLVTANLPGPAKDSTQSAAVSRKASSAGIHPTPDTPSLLDICASEPRYVFEDPRRKLYCSDECYNIDLGKAPTRDPQVKVEQADTKQQPHKIQRQLTLEMPWYQRQQDDDIKESYGFRRMRQNYRDDSDEEQLTMNTSRHSPITPLSPRNRRERKRSKVAAALPEPTSATMTRPRVERSATLDDPEVDPPATRRHQRRDTSRSLPINSMIPPLSSPSSPQNSPLYFRRMPGALETTPVNDGPMFTINGRRTTTPPPWFNYGAYLKKQENERRRKQRELNEQLASATKGKMTAEEQALAKRKARLAVERKRLDAKRREVVGYSNEEDLDPSLELPWWRIDEREDWRTYWEAREGGLELSFEEWQLRRHQERVEGVMRNEMRERYAADLKLTRRRDGKKVAGRPMLIRVASQPTLSDHRLTLTDLTAKPRPRPNLKRHTSSTSGSEVASPLEMSRPKVLPSVIPEDAHNAASNVDDVAPPTSTRITSFDVIEEASNSPFSQANERSSARRRVTSLQKSNKRWSIAGAPTSPLALHTVVSATPGNFSAGPAENSVRTIRRKHEDSSFTPNVRALSPLIIKTEVSVGANSDAPLNATLSLKKTQQELPSNEVSGSPETSVPPSGVTSGSSGEESSWSSGEGNSGKKLQGGRVAGYVQPPRRPALPNRESIDSLELSAHRLTEVDPPVAADSGFAWFFKTCSERVSSMPNASILGKWGATAMTSTSHAEKRRSLWDILGPTKP